MSKKIKKCLVCGKEYEACPYCEKQNDFYAWRTVCCSKECFSFHLPIIRYVRNKISKDQAKEELEQAKKYWNNVPRFLSEIKIIYDKIMFEQKDGASDTKTNKVVKKKIKKE